VQRELFIDSALRFVLLLTTDTVVGSICEAERATGN